MKKIQSTTLFLLLLILFSNCNNSNEDENQTSLDIELSEISNIKKYSLPDEVKVYNDFIGAKKWFDKNGDNIFVAYSKTNYKAVDFYGVHYIKDTTSTKYRILRKIHDFKKQSNGFIPLFYFHENYFTITDEDNNGFAEITVLYNIDIEIEGPPTLKLIMLEDGEKFAIRGSRKVYFDGIDYKEVKKMDFKNAAPELIEFADNVWTLYTTRKYNSQKDNSLKHEFTMLKAELKAAEDILIEIKKPKTFRSSRKKEQQIREQHLIIEILKQEITGMQEVINNN